MDINYKLVSEFTYPEKSIVWSYRMWVKLISIAKDPRQTLIKKFSQSLVQEAVYHFDKFMRITAYNAYRPVDIRFPCCLYIGEGELEILSTLSFSQGNFHELKEILLNRWIPKNSIKDASNSIDEIAKSFAKAGLFFLFTMSLLNQ